MRFGTAVAMGVLGLGILACGGGGGMAGSSDYMITADITPPWDSMNLPIENGNIAASNASMITIQYKGGDKAELFERFSKIFVDKNMEVVVSDTTRETMTAVYRKDGKQFTVSAVPFEMLGMVSISLGSDDI